MHLEFELGDPGSNPGSRHYSTGLQPWASCLLTLPLHIGWLRGIEKFEGEIENFIPNTFINFKPVKRFENRSGVSSTQFLRSEKLRYRKGVFGA